MDMLTEVLGQAPPLRLRAWDGSLAGDPSGPVLVMRDRRALRRLLWRPDEMGLARAYVAGELDVEGDLGTALAALARLVDRFDLRALRLTAGQRARLAASALRLGALGLQPPPPPEEAHVTDGAKHSKDRDEAAVTHHYDVGNDFYRLVLGPSMVYSCAYWTDTDETGQAGAPPSYTLADAQRDKLELVARKLGLDEAGPTARLLDVGCGWGSLVLHAAREYGVRAVGVTVSGAQADLARQRVTEAGLADRVEIRQQDYRDVHDGPYDAIASIGMAEHVGRAPYLDYARGLFGLLRPGGRLLNQQIARRPGPTSEQATFINSYVFPDGELSPLGETVELIEQAGLEVRDVQAMREHYARTLHAWVANLEAHWDEAVHLAGQGRARVWRLYMAASALAFRLGRIGVNQVLAIKPYDDGRSGMPGTRAVLLGAPAASLDRHRRSA